MKEQTDKRKKIIIIVAAAILVAVAVSIFLYFNSRIRATTMRLLRMEGEVTLEDNGKIKSITDNMRLVSGNVLSTAVESLVSIGLDETKVVTLDEKSRAEFNKSGRKLDLNLTDGALFFEVSKPLEDDESFDIRTSTMIVGIRGTSGYVTVDKDGRWNIVVTDGKVHVTGVNPKTGETIETDIKAGQRCTVYLYDRDTNSVLFTLEDVTEDEIPDFVVKIFRDEPELLDKVISDTDWSKPVILGEETDETAGTMDAGDETEELDVLADEVVPDADIIEETIETKTEELPKENAKVSDISDAELELVKNVMSGIDAATGLIELPDGTLFDPAWYAESNPDVVAKYGLSMEALIAHYIKFGKQEGRPPLRPESTVSETPKQASEPEDDEDDSSSNNTPAPPPPIEYNKVGTNGSFTLTGGTTGTYDDQTSKISISTTGSNGKVTLPVNLEVNGVSTNFSRSQIASLGDATSLDASADTNYTWSDAMSDFGNNSNLTEISTSTAKLTKNNGKYDVVASGAAGGRDDILNNCISGNALNSNFNSLTFPSATQTGSSLTITESSSYGGYPMDASYNGYVYNLYDVNKSSGVVSRYSGGTSIPFVKINDNGTVERYTYP